MQEVAITISSAAAQRVREFLAKDANAQGLRFGVKKMGCSGWGYTVDMAHEIAPEDSVFESEGVKVVVNREHLELLNGTHIDFVRQGINRVFAFSNPNAVNECGCGESFTTSDEH